MLFLGETRVSRLFEGPILNPLRAWAELILCHHPLRLLSCPPPQHSHDYRLSLALLINVLSHARLYLLAFPAVPHDFVHGKDQEPGVKIRRLLDLGLWLNVLSRGQAQSCFVAQGCLIMGQAPLSTVDWERHPSSLPP